MMVEWSMDGGGATVLRSGALAGAYYRTGPFKLSFMSLFSTHLRLFKLELILKWKQRFYIGSTASAASNLTIHLKMTLDYDAFRLKFNQGIGYELQITAHDLQQLVL